MNRSAILGCIGCIFCLLSLLDFYFVNPVAAVVISALPLFGLCATMIIVIRAKLRNKTENSGGAGHKV